MKSQAAFSKGNVVNGEPLESVLSEVALFYRQLMLCGLCRLS